MLSQNLEKGYGSLCSRARYDPSKNNITLQVKKLRDALELKAIASYYIKTLFLWKIEKKGKKFWQDKLSFTFPVMVEELRDAIKDKNIPYYWHKDNNLIEGLKPTLQKVYLDKLNDVVNAIAANDVDKIVGALLTTTEMVEFKKSEFYQKQPVKDTVDSSSVSRQMSLASSPAASVSRQSSTSTVSNHSTQEPSNGSSKTDSLIKLLIEKVETLTDKVVSLEDRMIRLEMATLKKNNIDEQMFKILADTKSIRLEDSNHVLKSTNNLNASLVGQRIPVASDVENLLEF